MGFGTIASQLILFIAIITVTGSVVIVLNNYSAQTSQSLKVEKDRTIDVLRTSVIITSVFFESTSNVTTIYAKNAGKTKLELNQSDLYLDGTRYGSTERNATIEVDTEKGSIAAWEPEEIVKFQVYSELSSGIHTAKIVAPNGKYDEEIFSK